MSYPSSFVGFALFLALLVGPISSAEAQSRRAKRYSAQERAQIRATPILERPSRPLHFYGNTVRRNSARQVKSADTSVVAQKARLPQISLRDQRLQIPPPKAKTLAQQKMDPRTLAQQQPEDSLALLRPPIEESPQPMSADVPSILSTRTPSGRVAGLTGKFSQAKPVGKSSRRDFPKPTAAIER